MKNIVEYSNLSYTNKEMFDKYNGVFLIIVGDKSSRFYPEEMQTFQSNVFDIYNQAVNDNNFILGHGIYWFAENIKIVLSLCVEQNKNNVLLNYNTLERTLQHISELTNKPIFIYWPFIQNIISFEWFENFLENAELKRNNKIYLTGISSL